ncbi:hypothetical protein NE235_29650 [Actinoallomurus spadix]|uniref:hypothetical protein n=1 Tax=Actinoallomurus spadix TaxID=79912 RepID=UPI002092B623|nr:hypothetical protein [Actinoallomurus spadix]MCO5990287.1 hypothetical protein [Actinoallomurus spadix]
MRWRRSRRLLDPDDIDRLVERIDAEGVELKQVVAANDRAAEPRRRPRRWTGRRLALAAGAVAAAVGTMIAVPALTENRSAEANAAERAPDGSIAVHLVEFTHPERVEQKLRAFGIPAKVDFLPFGTQCKGREFDGDFWMTDKPVRGPRRRHRRLIPGRPQWRSAPGSRRVFRSAPIPAPSLSSPGRRGRVFPRRTSPRPWSSPGAGRRSAPDRVDVPVGDRAAQCPIGSTPP